MAMVEVKSRGVYISSSEGLNERLMAGMTAKQQKVFHEIIQLIDKVPKGISPGRLSQLSTKSRFLSDWPGNLCRSYQPII